MASNSALELLKREHAEKIRAANRRAKEQHFSNTLVRKGAGMAAATAIGTLNRFDVPVTVGSWFPWKLAVSAVALTVEALTKGKVQAAAAGVTETVNAIYLERSISENTLIVGAAPTGYIAEGHVPPQVFEETVAVSDGGEV